MVGHFVTFWIIQTKINFIIGATSFVENHAYVWAYINSLNFRYNAVNKIMKKINEGSIQMAYSWKSSWTETRSVVLWSATCVTQVPSRK